VAGRCVSLADGVQHTSGARCHDAPQVTFEFFLQRNLKGLKTLFSFLNLRILKNRKRPLAVKFGCNFSCRCCFIY
jgi:hypothetical protein